MRIRNILKFPLQKTCLFIFSISSILLLGHHLAAGLKPQETMLQVEIGDTNYGMIDELDGIDQISQADQNGHRTVTLSRNFVTEPSLYLWAKTFGMRHNDMKDMNLLVKSSLGETLRTITLKNCHPLSWTIETGEQQTGGFYEKISIAVQDIIEN